MENVADELRRVVDGAAQELTGITDAESSLHPAEGKWSKKEILGHLIDSASNNHQRFVRAQLSAEIRLPAYEQSAWVKTQAYENEPWDALLVFWKSYNAHLVHVLTSMPPEIKDHYCFIGEGQPVTVGQLAKDYLQHVRHHLEQLTA